MVQCISYLIHNQNGCTTDSEIDSRSFLGPVVAGKIQRPNKGVHTVDTVRHATAYGKRLTGFSPTVLGCEFHHDWRRQDLISEGRRRKKLFKKMA